ncbi:ParA family protein [Streptomyces ferrugineus]|uniref:ParA family protein n=1 Tax=Streptomyces ferrugineus TaxID=1413221 RepID=A0A7M2SPM0_9ACTN|nr:ParA family protein [Streptomyces ferrugineus]QOV37201.1 ParA family protein [Streptomyces ferrugineus]
MTGEATTNRSVRQQIEGNAHSAGLTDAQIYVTEDGFGSYLVRVVHESLDALDDSERRKLLLKGVANIVSTAELITPGEEEWYGPPFSESTGQMPLWHEVLSRPLSADELTFATDLDQDIELPAIVTFYSLRGGVGRTTALAAAARILSERGRRLLCVDMDLEAPGLATVLGCPEPREDQGVLPLLLALERGDEVDIRDHVLRVNEGEELYCLPAGRLSSDYADRLRLLDPEIWYREAGNPLHQLLQLAKESALEPDLILLDSRTGISPVAAPLLFDVSDLAIICFYPHPQAERGTELLVKALMSAKSRRATSDTPLTPEPRFIVSPVPPGPSAETVLTRAVTWIDHWIGDAQSRRPGEYDPLRADEITHAVSYSPDTAFRDKVSNGVATREAYGAVADWLEQLLPQTYALSASSRNRKHDVLEQLDFSTGTAEQQASLLDDFVHTRVAQQALDARSPLVIGRKGTGKTAVFRWLMERYRENENPVVVFSPHAFRNSYKWTLGSEALEIVESEFPGESAWTTFWPCYTALAAYFALPPEERADPPARFEINKESLDAVYDELSTLDVIKHMMSRPMAGLLGSRWLRDINSSAKNRHMLLFDGLDTGFGNNAESRKRRTRAVTGLMTFLTESEAHLSLLSFKVMLRVDIWQQLRFENKSHLYGRSVQLMWRDQNDYFKTVLKQAIRSEIYREMLAETRVGPSVDDWRDDEVRRAWNVLVGERMKGGKTTFTRNWVWNRLADGQGDHGPRSLSQLFHEAVQWEKREEARSSYDRSIMRPRALVPSLDKVSVEALSALQEEFPELDGVVEALRSLRRTPIEPGEIEAVDPTAAERVDLALEVGLLEIYEGTQDDVRRYRVPDLYRLALGLTRRGQA